MAVTELKYPRLEKAAREVIDNALKKDLSVVTTLAGYETKADMLVLRDLLRYASEMGVSVVFEPKPLPSTIFNEEIN